MREPQIDALPPAATAENLLRRSLIADLNLPDEYFNYFRLLAMTHAGISLPDYKRNMVCRRVCKRLVALQLDSFDQYILHLKGEHGQAEIEYFINALTTNKTEFFREAHHFRHLSTSVLAPARARLARDPGFRLRIWSAGCSSGQEPYSIAMTIADQIPDFARYDIRILATDIDTEMTGLGRQAIYASEELDQVPERFLGSVEGRAGVSRLAAPLRNLIRFNSLNLHSPWPIKGLFDAIFCRNVIIYFDKPSQVSLFERFAQVLVPGGQLYIGHSESLYKVSDRFEAVGQSVYRKLR